MNDPGGAVVAVDPGRDKCGVAALAADGELLARAIVATDEIGGVVARLARKHGAAAILIGARTGVGAVRQAIEAAAPDATIAEVDEHMTTLQARERYWREHPPRGVWRLVPRGLRVPPVPVDDWAAVILAERYLEGGAG